MIVRLLTPLGLTPADLPAVNAVLNASCAVLLILGYLAIRNGSRRVHAGLMLTAFSVSIVFLASYLYYHFVVRDGRPTKFTTEGLPRIAYLTVLLTHTVLAVAVAALAPITLFLGMTESFGRHKRLARWTLPIWLYVSITGVVVYWMLYHLYPPA